jgi:hypothetical protein
MSQDHSEILTSVARFWKKVDKSDGEGCWLWTGGKSTLGSGRIWMNGQMHVASRIVWELTHGPIPKGLLVCHTCDNPSCVNPEHLFLGTQNDNMRDASSKGRMRGPSLKGENNPAHKLTNDQARAIKRLRGWYSSNLLAAAFGVARAQILSIWSGKTWRFIN